MLLEYDETSPIIISTSEEISIKEVAQKVAKIMGYKNKIYWDTTKPNGQFRKPSDNFKLKSVLKDFQFTPLEEGLNDTIEFFIKNYEKIRK